MSHDIPRRQAGLTTFPDDTRYLAREALQVSGANWRVIEKHAGYTDTDRESPVGGDSRWTVDEDFKALIREDTGKRLGFVGSGYGVLQNDVAFDFLDPFIENGTARIDKAGCLDGGKRVILEAVVLDPETGLVRTNDVGHRDAIEERLIMWNSHDGGSSVTTGILPYRRICTNGLMVIDRKHQSVVRMRHTGSLEARVKQFQQFLLDAEHKFGGLIEVFRGMSQKTMTMEQFEQYAKTVLGWKDEDEHKIQEPRALSDLRVLFARGPGVGEFEGTRGTVWAGYNAFTRWIDHERGKEEKRYEASRFGSGVPIRNRAFAAAAMST
jgi:phage/plasmid-like protein (TIGR03299 family)